MTASVQPAKPNRVTRTGLRSRFPTATALNCGASIHPGPLPSQPTSLHLLSILFRPATAFSLFSIFFYSCQCPSFSHPAAFATGTSFPITANFHRQYSLLPSLLTLTVLRLPFCFSFRFRFSFSSVSFSFSVSYPFFSYGWSCGSHYWPAHHKKALTTTTPLI